MIGFAQSAITITKDTMMCAIGPDASLETVGVCAVTGIAATESSAIGVTHHAECLGPTPMIGSVRRPVQHDSRQAGKARTERDKNSIMHAWTFC